jgi:hypothetical protein
MHLIARESSKAPAATDMKFIAPLLLCTAQKRQREEFLCRVLQLNGTKLSSGTFYW